MITSEKAPKIAFYNIPPGFGAEELNGRMLEGFEFTSDHHHLEQATAVVFHMPTLSPDDKILSKDRKREGQVWVFWSAECEARFEWQQRPDILQLFDIMATYKLNSDVPLPYIHSYYYGALRREPVKKTGVVCAFVSDTFDQSDRLSNLKELMSYINVYTYGDSEGRQKIMESYKFTIAFEDAIAQDYVTGKLFEPLIAGSVPIYLGAPNVEEFLPGDRCFVNMDDFPSIKALADHLLELDANDERYNGYLEWKTRPFRLSFNKKSIFVARHPLNRLCSIVKERMHILKSPASLYDKS